MKTRTKAYSEMIKVDKENRFLAARNIISNFTVQDCLATAFFVKNARKFIKYQIEFSEFARACMTQDTSEKQVQFKKSQQCQNATDKDLQDALDDLSKDLDDLGVYKNVVKHSRFWQNLNVGFFFSSVQNYPFEQYTNLKCKLFRYMSAWKESDLFLREDVKEATDFQKPKKKQESTQNSIFEQDSTLTVPVLASSLSCKDCVTVHSECSPFTVAAQSDDFAAKPNSVNSVALSSFSAMLDSESDSGLFSVKTVRLKAEKKFQKKFQRKFAKTWKVRKSGRMNGKKNECNSARLEYSLNGTLECSGENLQQFSQCTFQQVSDSEKEPADKKKVLETDCRIQQETDVIIVTDLSDGLNESSAIVI